MKFIDTHCHIHSIDYTIEPQQAINNALSMGVNKLICVGCDENDSELAIRFASLHENIWASVGLHPHDAKLGQEAFDKLATLATMPKVVAIGECGLDYYYNHSGKEDQEKALKYQMELALSNNLPMIFHVRDAFDDFWPIFDQYKGLKGVIHSFTSNTVHLTEALNRGLYIGLNGIMTFTKDNEQLNMATQVPLDRLLLETDSPFLTPRPQRGKVNEPKNIVLIAEFLADLRHQDLDEIGASSTSNAKQLFGI
ncbi:MAG: TatD DNase family protein [Patescibacteria group bacterium]|nr:TatD DNase family protein [Patescibacteria group bacterium]